jgi:D-galactarolactone cycloisomerase
VLIERIEAIPLRLPYTATSAGVEPRHHYLVLCRVTTRCGLVGYGEALCYMAPFQRQLVASILDVVAPLYLGRDVADRQALNLASRRKLAWSGRAGAAVNAIAAIDIALWDIAGKAVGQSLSALLGHPDPPPIRAMASLDQRESPEAILELAEAAMSAGAAAIKIHDDRLDVAERVADRLVRGTRLALDTNNRWTRRELEQGRDRLAALDLLWLEDPIWPPEDLLTAPSLPGIPVAMGADLGSAEQMALYGAADGVAIVQPDLCMIGGISEMPRTFEILGPLDVQTIPHTPFIGPAGLATLHLMAARAPTGLYAVIEAEAAMDICGAGLAECGYEIAVPRGPGLGADPDPVALRAFAVG